MKRYCSAELRVIRLQGYIDTIGASGDANDVVNPMFGDVPGRWGRPYGKVYGEDYSIEYEDSYTNRYEDNFGMY